MDASAYVPPFARVTSALGGGNKAPAFYLLCAYGYDVEHSQEPDTPTYVPAEPHESDIWAGPRAEGAEQVVHTPSAAAVRPRLLRVWAAQGTTTADWVEFFSSWPGRPQVLVSDGAPEILSAKRSVWPGQLGLPAPEHVRCRWHLLQNLRDHIAIDLARADTGPGKFGAKYKRAQSAPLWEMAEMAFADERRWQLFRHLAYDGLGHLWFGERAVRGHKDPVPYERETLAWLRANDMLVRVQMLRRPFRPGPEAIGPLEAHIEKLRRRLAGRAQVLANRERTQLLLRLLTAGIRGDAEQPLWAERIRQYLTELEGVAPKQRPLAVTGGHRTL